MVTLALRQASDTIDLVSRVSGPKGLFSTLSLPKPCISTSRVAMAMVRCVGKVGRKSFDYPVTILPPIPLWTESILLRE